MALTPTVYLRHVIATPCVEIRPLFVGGLVHIHTEGVRFALCDCLVK